MGDYSLYSNEWAYCVPCDRQTDRQTDRCLLHVMSSRRQDNYEYCNSLVTFSTQQRGSRFKYSTISAARWHHWPNTGTTALTRSSGHEQAFCLGVGPIHSCEIAACCETVLYPSDRLASCFLYVYSRIMRKFMQKIAANVWIDELHTPRQWQSNFLVEICQIARLAIRRWIMAWNKQTMSYFVWRPLFSNVY